MNKGSSWTEVSLGEICEFKYGKSLPAKNRTPGSHPVYGSNGQVGTHIFSLNDGPTIIIGRKGSLGEVAYSPTSCWPIDTTYFVDSSSARVDLKWLFYRLRSLGLTELNRAAVIPGLNREDAYKKRFLLPPPGEQRQIVEVLDRADAMRAKRRQAIAVLRELSQSIFFDMFGDSMENPHRFEVKPLKEWVARDRPITYGILKPGEDDADGVPYVRVADMKECGINESGLKRTTQEIASQYRRSMLSVGDLLISIRGHVGRLVKVPNSLNGANITQDSARLAIPAASSEYVMECLRTSSTQFWMQRRVKGAAVKGINLSDVRELPIPEPPLNLQQEFAARLIGCKSQLHHAREHLRRLDDLFGSLQQRAFRGELWED